MRFTCTGTIAGRPARVEWSDESDAYLFERTPESLISGDAAAVLDVLGCALTGDIPVTASGPFVLGDLTVPWVALLVMVEVFDAGPTLSGQVPEVPDVSDDLPPGSVP